jgi:hypothetical protein
MYSLHEVYEVRVYTQWTGHYIRFFHLQARNT